MASAHLRMAAPALQNPGQSVKRRYIPDRFDWRTALSRMAVCTWSSRPPCLLYNPGWIERFALLDGQTPGSVGASADLATRTASNRTVLTTDPRDITRMSLLKD